MHGSAPARPRRSVITSIAVFATTKWKATAGLLAVVVIAGLSAFTFGLDREGFLLINTPISVVSGTWFVDDATVVDDELVRPFKEQFETVDGVVSVDSEEARPSSFAIVVEFDSDIDSATGTVLLSDLELASPDGADVTYNAVNAAKLVGRYDASASVIGPAGAEPADLEVQAASLAAYLAADDAIDAADVRNLVTDVDRSVDRCRRTTPDVVHAHPPSRARDTTMRSLWGSSAPTMPTSTCCSSATASTACSRARTLRSPRATTGSVTADFATGVRSQLSSLTTNLLTGLAAVAVVSLILIGWRVALLTAGFMGLVTLGSLAGLWGIGFSLNTITLFGRILRSVSSSTTRS